MNDPNSKESLAPHILVIEDDPAQRLFLDKVLAMSGWTCKVASTCAEARMLFAKDKFACALVDLGLPDGSGMGLLHEFHGEDPCLTLIVLTGDASPETIIGSMRKGAFDYLTKPVDITLLTAAVTRALAHHTLLRERSELLALLLDEREKLRARVELATADIRQYAAACELSNTRLRALLNLTQLSAGHYSDRTLLMSVFSELSRHLPFCCVALCDITRQKFVAVTGREDGELEFHSADGVMETSGLDVMLTDADPAFQIQSWVSRYTGLDTQGMSVFVYPQTFWNRSISTIGFYLRPGFVGDEVEQEFLGMCAYFLAFEYEQARLLLQIAHQASLGNIGVELARNFVPPLSAIRVAADFVSETGLSSEASQGVDIIQQNVERLRRQTQEFRKLSSLREDSLETVRLDEIVGQALEMLSVTIQNRGVRIEQAFEADCQCVLLNGTALARTILDLILNALRTVEVGGLVSIRVFESDPDHVAFEIRHAGTAENYYCKEDMAFFPTAPGPAHRHPGLQLAERTVHSCGGVISVSLDDREQCRLCVLLPRNAANPGAKREKMA